MMEWYERSFGEDYLLVYKHRDVQGAKREVHKMISWLHLKQDAQVLDLCCGMGRHAMALVELGYDVTGVDLSDVLLREAVRNDPQGQVTWLKGDMRAVPLKDKYDAVVNLFTSFGYFEKDEEHIKVLQEIARLLQPQGRFIIDYLNPTYTAQHLVLQSQRWDAGQHIIESRKIEDGYVKKEITIINSNIVSGNIGSNNIDENCTAEKRNYLERIKLYNQDQFVTMLSQAGLTVEHIYGGYDEEQYDAATSARMIIVGSLI
jgi:ubiquinone/menaquinone biosynthesis C-methylase UbiE